MKKLLFTLSIVFMLSAYDAKAQLQFNPQLGMVFQNLTDPPEGVDYKANVGFQIGADARIGGRLHLQPGLYFSRTSVATKYSNADTVTIDDDLIRSNLKIKLLGGYNLVHKDGFKLRVNAGPTYDFLIDAGSKDDNIDYSKNDFENGSFNLDFGLGVDIWFVTAEMGYSLGLTNAIKDQNGSSIDSKNAGIYFNVGIVFGNGMKK